MESFEHDDIVISGVGGRYPSSDSLQEFAENLLNGVDMTSENNPKWTPGTMGVPHKIGCMKDLNKCDAQFFGIIRKHCNSLDPITRQILERTLEAIFDAGLNPLDLKGSNTGVFMSCALLETEMILVQSNDQETYGIMGRNRALNANRISYWLDLKGPSYSTDCLFNGGLQGIQEAYNAIKSGRIDAAIVGSGSTIIHPQSSYQYDKLKVLSADGNTRAFDCDAYGYARAEAVSIMLLQRASDAKRCYGTIMHVLNQSMSATSNLLMQPSQNNWRDLYETFYSECKVDPSEISYIEADGMANQDMDAAELNAIGEFFGAGRTVKNPIFVGSVKSNMGHAEGASNMCAIAKLIATIKSDVIPPNLHYKQPNPKVRDLVQGKIKVVTEPTPLDGDYVAMSSFGLGSTYGHLLLRKNLKAKKATELKEGELPYIALLSSRHEEGIEQVLNQTESAPFDPEYIKLINNAFRSNLQGHMYRGFTVVPVQEPKIHESSHFSGDKLPVWFVYSGMGSQWPTMGKDLLNLPIFRKSIEISHNVLKAHDIDLIHILTHDDATLFDNILHNFVCIVSVQIALTDVLRDLGIEPDGIIGHSVGETSASYADGCLTQEQTMLSAYYRGRASLETKVIKGMMAAVGLGYEKMKDRLPEGVQVACHNSADSCTLSGPAEAVEKLVKDLSAEGVFARAVNVANIPYHSKYIQEMGPKMHNYLKHVIPEGKKRSPRWISTSIPESRWSEPSALNCNAEYHINNLLSPVLFEEGSKHIPEKAVTIEIAPHGLLQAILKRSLTSCVNIPLTNRNVKNQQHVLLKAVGKMYLNGLNPKVECLYPNVSYPVSRGTGYISPLVTWDHSDNWSNFSSVSLVRTYKYSGYWDVKNSNAQKASFQDKNQNSRIINLHLDEGESILKAHKEDGSAVLPCATALIHVWEVFAASKEKKVEEMVVYFNDVVFHTNLSVQNKTELRLHILIQPASNCFEVLREEDDGDELIITGSISEVEKLIPRSEQTFEFSQEILKDEFYSELLHVGHSYDQQLQTVDKVLIGNNAWKGAIESPLDAVTLLETLLQIKLLQATKSTPSISKIKKIRRIVIDPNDLKKEKVEVMLDLDTDVLYCGNTEIRDVHLESVPLNPVKFCKADLNNETFTLPQNGENLRISCIQFKGDKVEGKQVAFSGNRSSKNENIMGVGVADEISATVKVDDNLQWHIPKNWTSVQAVDIVFYYSLAYYAVHIVGQLAANQSIAITDGANRLGLACLRVALNITTQVFTVVSSKEEKLHLLAMLPQLCSDNIIINESRCSEQLSLKLRSRFPKKVNLLINTGEPDNAQVVIQCIKPFGIVVEMTEELFDSRGKLKNTFGFLISASLYSCSGKDLSNSYVDTKEEVHKLMEQGILSGVVIPFEPKSLNWRGVKTMQIEDNQKNDITSRFQCDPNRAYLILGGDPYTWLAIVEWFINRRAKNIFVVHKGAILNNSLQKKLKTLQDKINLTVRSTETISPELINHIFDVSKIPIDLTMLIPFTTTDKIEEAVVKALCQKDTFLVTILRGESEGIECCKERVPNDRRTLTVVWNEPLYGKTKGFLQTFDKLLSKGINEVVLVAEETEENSVGVDPYENVLPKSLDEIIMYREDLLHDFKVTELQTKSVPFEFTKEISPLFIFPGLTNRRALIERFKEAIYPVYIIDCPSTAKTSLHQYASVVAPKIRAITNGPYSLCGEGWGGALALEVAHLLEIKGNKTIVFLLAATPVELLQWETIEEFEATLLSRVFNVSKELIANEKSWFEKVVKCLTNSSQVNEKSVREGINAIRDKAESMLVSHRKTTLDATIISISKKIIPRPAISWMSRNDIQLYLVNASESLLNDDVFDIIHTAVLAKTIPK